MPNNDGVLSTQSFTSPSVEKEWIENKNFSYFSDRPYAFFFRYIRKHAFAHSVILLSIFLAVGCSLASQYAVKHLVDVLQLGKDQQFALTMAFALLATLIAADNLLWRVGGWISAYTFVNVTGDLRQDLFRYLSGHSHRYFSEKQPGTLASRVTATSNAVFTSENTFAWNVLPPFIAVVGSIAMMVMVKLEIAISLFILCSILAVIIFNLAKKGRRHHQQFAKKAAEVDGEQVDVISNMGLVRAFGATFREQIRFNTKLSDEMSARTKSLLYLEKLRLLHAFMTAFFSAGILGWAIFLWQRGEISSGDVVLTSTLGFTILHGTRDLAVALVDITQHLARLSEALLILLQPHHLPDHPHAQPLVEKGGRVDFEKVTFSYPHRKPTLQAFDLHIEPGQRVGLIGHSGAGKTTVLALLQHFYAVSDGAIKVDGQDISLLTRQSLQGTIALVPQDIALFNRTIFENIHYGKPTASKEEVYAASKEAHCTEFIEAMPEGFNTIVGDRGVKLSGGQRQRIAIARALLKNTPILLLDEATSALDSASEKAIQEAINRLMQGRTVIAIAHRLSTLKNFDRIIVMQHGQVIDDGAPSVLSQRPGLYRDLLSHQYEKHLPYEENEIDGLLVR